MRFITLRKDGTVNRIVVGHPLHRPGSSLWNSTVGLKEEYDRLHAERLNLHAVSDELAANLGDDAVTGLPGPASGNVQVSI